MDANQIISVGIVTTLVWSGMVGPNQILGKEVLVCPFELYIPLIRTAILKAPVHRDSWYPLLQLPPQLILLVLTLLVLTFFLLSPLHPKTEKTE